MEKSKWIKVVVLGMVLVMMLVGVFFLSHYLNESRSNHDKSDNSDIADLDVINEFIESIEEEYVDDSGMISLEEAPELIDAVYKKARKFDSVSYCEKNLLSVYMILNNGIGVHYHAPVDGVASSGDEIAIYSYQPYHDEFNESDVLIFGNVRDGEYPDKAIKKLENLSTTASPATVLQDTDVTIEALKSMRGGSVIVWVGHGGYSSKYHSTLILTISYTEKLYQKYKKDFDSHRLEIAKVNGEKMVCVTSLFFDYYLEDDVLENSVIYLGACHSGEDNVLANSLLDKGATTVYVNSDTVYQKYNNNMCRTVMEALCDGKTTDEALKTAKSKHGEKDNVLFGIISRDAKVYRLGDGSLTLDKLYQRLKGDSHTHTVVVDAAVNASCTKTGLTAGKHCSTCGEIIVAQQVVAMKQHIESDWKIDKDATTSSIGKKHTECTICGQIIHEEIIPQIEVAGSSLIFTLNSDKSSYSVTDIGTYKDSTVVIPSEYNGKPVTAIAKNAFKDCSHIVILEIPDSVKTIGDSAFHNCSNLQLINIGTHDSVLNSLGSMIAYGSIQLSSINYNGTMKEWKAISNYSGDWFKGTYGGLIVYCTDGKFIYDWDGTPGPDKAPVEVPNEKPEEGDGVSDGLVFEFWDFADDMHEWIKPGWCVTYTWDLEARENCTDKEIVLPGEYKGKPVTIIGEGAFIGLQSVECIIIPDSITTISDCAFAGCPLLKQIIVPDYVVLFDGPFRRCPALENVVLGEHVVFDGNRPFADCPNLKYITYNGTMEQWFNLEGVDGISVNCPIYCTDGIISNDQDDSKWYLGEWQVWESSINWKDWEDSMAFEISDDQFTIKYINYGVEYSFSYVETQDEHYTYLELDNEEVVVVFLDDNTLAICNSSENAYYKGVSPNGTTFDGEIYYIAHKGTYSKNLPSNINMNAFKEACDDFDIGNVATIMYYPSCSLLYVNDDGYNSETIVFYVKANGDVVYVEQLAIAYLGKYKYDDIMTDHSFVITDCQ